MTEPKPPSLSSGLVTKQETQLARLQEFWNDVLTLTEDNKFPLAPFDLLEAGAVTEASYNEANKALAEFCERLMKEQLSAIVQEPDFMEGPRNVQILGAGLTRDLGWLKDAATHFREITITDISNVALDNADKLIEEQGLASTVLTQRSEVIEAWAPDGFIGEQAEEETLFYYAGNFIQIQDKPTKDLMLKHLGAFLAKPTNEEKTAFRRRVYLLHPLGEDNPPDKVKWRRTTPYTIDELRAPFEEGFGGPLKIEVVANEKHKYFDHRTYSLICIAVPENE